MSRARRDTRGVANPVQDAGMNTRERTPQSYPTWSPPKAGGLRFARLMMVLASLAPLFVLWAVRGSTFIPDLYLVPACASCIVVPNLFLLARLSIARRRNDNYRLIVDSSEDHRDQLLVYLFAVLLPFYAIDVASWRDVLALLTAVGFIAFLFLYMNLHYLNVLFALRGYRVFTIVIRQGDQGASDPRPRVLVTRRDHVPTGQLFATRLSDTVFVEGA